MPITRRLATQASLLALSATAVPRALAQKFPDKPIRIVNTFAAGGPSDVAARLVAQQMAEALGQQVVVENRPGGGGMIAAAYVASQPADGHTLLLANNQVNSNSLLYRKMPYKMSDFTPVSLVMKSCNTMVVPASLPVKNVREFVEYARQRPGAVNYAILGPGGSPHMNGKMLEKAGGIRMTEVSYKGAAEAVQDLYAERVQAMFVTTSGAVSYQASGKARILAVTAAERLEFVPDLPTFKEQGFDVVSYSWFGLVAPAATPKDRVDLLSKAVARGVASPEFQKAMKAGGNIPASLTPEQMTAFLKEDFASWEAILKPLGLQLD